MTRPFVRILLALAFIATLGLGAWGVAAAHGGGGGGGHHDCHAAAHAHHAMAALIEELKLDDAQKQQLHDLHDAMQAMHDGHQGGGMAGHLHTMVEHIHRGQLNSGAVRQMVDQHIDQMRHWGYRLGDAIVALLDSFDADQRAILDAHLERAAAHREAHKGE